MKEVRTTLKARIIVLLVMSSLFLVSSFTAIQVNNQVRRSREFSVFRTKEAAFLVGDKMQDIFAGEGAQLSRQQTIDRIKDVFRSVLDTGMIDTAVLMDEQGTTLLLEGDLKFYTEEDRSRLKYITSQRNSEKWLFPVIDKSNKIGHLFIGMENKYNFLLKLSYSLDNFQKALNEVYGPVFFMIIIVVLANMGLAVLLSRVIINPIKTLNEATKDIAAGDLDKSVKIDTKDELEELASTFNVMTVELRKMKARAISANPLTKLPGNMVISEQADKRILAEEKFVLIYTDLDNFKAFNDVYGLHSGDEAISLTAQILKEAVISRGEQRDFIGHQGGDDFILFVAPERAGAITDYIIREFDKRIKNFYTEEDIQKGYITGKDRDTGEVRKMPVMTISLAGVSNVEMALTSFAQITNIAADVKKAAKSRQGSNFVLFIERRKMDMGRNARGTATDSDNDEGERGDPLINE